MKKKRMIGRLDMRIRPEQETRIEKLIEKKGTNKSAVVNEAIKQMYDKEFPETGKVGK